MELGVERGRKKGLGMKMGEEVGGKRETGGGMEMKEWKWREGKRRA